MMVARTKYKKKNNSNVNKRKMDIKKQNDERKRNERRNDVHVRDVNDT